MADKIPLPPLHDEFLMHPTQGECYTADQLRARGLEVVRCVLEAAAVTAWTHYMDTCKKRKIAPANFEEWLAASAIRALEFTHG